MKVLIAVIGTLGDALAAVAVGRAMAGRGHAAVVLANPVFADLIAGAGLTPVPVGDAADFHALVDHPDYWHPERGFHWFAKGAILPSVKPLADAIEHHAESPRTVVAALNYGYGAWLAGERLGLPTVRLLTQPAMLEAVGGTGTARFARVVGSLEALFEYRGRTLGATPSSGAGRVAPVALFPAWFVPAGMVLAPGTVLTGFPDHDEGADYSLPPPLRAFLDAGPPPVALFGGSNGRQARDVLGTALAACGRVGRRALVVSRDPALADEAASAGALAIAYAPFTALLPRTAAVVHHGGIGTIARCLAAGVPQLALTANFETPDNAAAMTALGVGDSLPAERATVETLADRLAPLLASRTVAARCTEAAHLMSTDNPFERVCAVLERLAGEERAGRSPLRGSRGATKMPRS